MKKIKYCVWQGNFTESGEGDYWDEGEFDTLEEAKKRMYEIYNDMNGISKLPNGYLETLIEIVEYEEGSVVDNHDIDIIDGIRYDY